MKKLSLIQAVPTSKDITDIASRNDYSVSGILLLIVIGLALWIYFITKSHTKSTENKDAAHIKFLEQKNADHALAIKEKDEQIMKVIDEHKADLKDANKDYQVLVDKYHIFTDKVKAIADGKL
jgi:uncharacterized protein HemX